MNFSLRLCTLALLIFCFTLQVKPVVIAAEEIKSLSNKIEQGTKLNDDDLCLLNQLNKQHPDILPAKILTKLRSEGKLRMCKNHSSQKPFNNRRADIAEKILNILDKNNLVTLTSKFSQDLRKADYALIDNLVQNYFNKIETLEIKSNTSEDIDSCLKIALEYGISDVVKHLVENGATITLDHFNHLSQAQDKWEKESSFDCAWFKSGADFEKCREHLEAYFRA